jgi:hypothetical protein
MVKKKLTREASVTSNGARKHRTKRKPPPMTSAERQAAYKSRQREAGIGQINLMVPAHAVADFQRAAELIRANPRLTIARLVNLDTGKLKGIK